MGSIQPESNQDCIITDRGGIIECRHTIHAAVVDNTGRVLHTVGNASRVTLWRSAAKPAQALAIVETGCLEQFDFSEADLALMCASHNAEERHLARASSMLERIGASEDDLKCGGHPSINPEVVKEWAKMDFTPTAICNNCSGKHAGMLAGAKAIEAGFEGYHPPEHPMQVRVRKVVEDLCGEETHAVKWGIDGCNLPAPASPLHLLARMFATFAAAADAVDTNGQEACTLSNRTQACSRIFNAKSTYPELVAGEGRFCTDLMRAYKGSLIGKVGAEGCYGIGIRESEQTRRMGAVGAVGISVKVEDGNREILYSAVMEILEQLQISTLALRQELAAYKKKVVLNTAGVITGSVHHAFELRSATVAVPLENGRSL